VSIINLIIKWKNINHQDP